MVIGRVIGWILLFAAAVVLVRDLIAWLDSGAIAPIALGQLWADIDGPSLDGIHAAIRHDLPEWLAPRIDRALTQTWAMPALAAIGALVLWAFRRRGGTRRRRRRR